MIIVDRVVGRVEAL